MSTAFAGDGPNLCEAVHHFRLAGCRSEVVEYGSAAARHLKRTSQNRAAIDVFAAVRDALPRNRRKARLDVTLELAELYSRVRMLDEGINILRDWLSENRDERRATRARVLLRLATLHARGGDFKKAEPLFDEGFGGAQTELSRQELLFFFNEQTAMKAIVGDAEAALRICEEGLRLVRRSRSVVVREVALNLYATRASVAMRQFDFDTAIRECETALQIAEAIGSTANRAVILNNLGTVYGNSDRYTEAIDAFREAEAGCLALDEGPSLVSIYCNLAVLGSKTGRYGDMEAALAEAERMSPRGIGHRQTLLFEHASGISRLFQGRYPVARRHFEVASELGLQTGDRMLVAFDRVYRAEALVMEGAYAEATAELDRLADDNPPCQVQRMASARGALLAALTGRHDELGVAVNAWRTSVAGGASVPFLGAWDELFVGWALSIDGHATDAASSAASEATALLEKSERFFRRHDLFPGVSMVRWVRTEAAFLRGRWDGARDLLQQSDGEPCSGVTALLWPLLRACVLLEQDGTSEGRSRAADLLSEARASLVGNELREWALRYEAIRVALQRDIDQRLHRAIVDRRRELACELPQEARAGYHESAHWSRWTELPDNVRSADPTVVEPAPVPKQETTTQTVPLRARSARSQLVAKSPAMRELVGVLDRIRDADLPVLIRGEAGVVKEFIARLLYEGSSRNAAPFLVVDCATIPDGLLEVELFGAQAGAFTDLTEDRPGILATAKGGVVFIDEIAELPIETQGKLLRVFSDGGFRRVGEADERRIEDRFLLSTRRDLETEVNEGRFRDDLWHRISCLSVRVPPLRERPEDIPALVERFLDEGASQQRPRQRTPSLGRGVVERLQELRWPGNVWELRNLLARLATENPDEISLPLVEKALATVEHTDVFSPNVLAQESLPELRERLEREYVLFHFRRLRGDTRRLRDFLGWSRQRFYRQMRRLGIRLREERERANFGKDG